MSEKELLYIDDTLGHFTNINEYLKVHTDILEDEKFKTALKELDKINKDLYKKFYKLIEE